MNKLPFGNPSGTYYTPQGLVREKKQRDKRSRSKTVTDERNTIFKVASRSSEDERVSSPSPELVHTVPPPIAAMEDLPALPDSVPLTPATTAVESESSDTPKAVASAGSVAQYLQSFVEDVAEQVPSKEEDENKAAPLDNADLPPPPVTAVEKTPENSQTSVRVSDSRPDDNKDDGGSSRTGLPEEPHVSEDPSGKSRPVGSQPRAESSISHIVPSTVSTIGPAGPLVHHQHFHPAHGLPQHYAYHHPQSPYGGFPHSQETNMPPVSYQQSPGFPPLLSYSPIPAFHPYGPVHPMSLIPAGHLPPQYPQHPGSEIQNSPGLPARTERPPHAFAERKNDEAVIEEIADLLPDIIRLVTLDRNEKAEMKAMKLQYEKVIDALTADRNSLRHDIAESRQKAQRLDALVVDNARLMTEKHSIVEEVLSLKDDRANLIDSRDRLKTISVQQESTISDLKQRLEAERRSHGDALEAARLDVNRKIRLADETASSLRSDIAALISERNKQIASADETTAKLRSEVAELRSDRNNRIKDFEVLRKDHGTRVNQFEAKIRDLEDALDRSRKSKADDTTTKSIERCASVSATTGRDAALRSSTTGPLYEGSTPAATRRPNQSQAPASHRQSLSSQYFQSSNPNRSTTSDRVPGGYDYYDTEPPKNEHSSSSVSRSTGGGDSGRSDSRGSYHPGTTQM